MFEVMYFYVFCCLCYVKEILMNILTEHVLEDKYTDLNDEGYIRMEDSREEHWKDFLGIARIRGRLMP